MIVLPSSAAPGMPSDGTSGYAARISPVKKSGNAAMVAGLAPRSNMRGTALMPTGPKAMPSSEFAPSMMGTWTKLPEASCREVNLWTKSPSITGSKVVMAVNAV
jgi:hypothetical protein